MSGLDVDGMVMSLMKLEGAKVDKVAQDRQMLVWKQESYREITSMLQSLDNEFFNSLKPLSDMRNPSAYNAFAIKYDAVDSSSYFSAVTGTGAKAGEYAIKNIVTAAAAKISGGNASAAIRGNILGDEITITEANNKVSFTFNGTTKEITLDSGSTNAEQLRLDLQGKLNSAFGSGKVSVTLDAGNKLTFNTDSTNTLSLGAVEGNTGLAAIGMEGANTSNRIDLSVKIYDIRNSFAVPLTVAGTDNDISFEINGQAFSFNSSTTSIRDIMAEVNANDAAGVKMSFDSLNNKFTLESKQTGVTSKITSSDMSGGLLSSLSLVGTDVLGRDASITYNDGVNGDQVITRSTNSFNINGITFNLKKDYSDTVNVEVSSDTSKAVELVKGFITKYNEVLDKINAKLSEKRDYDFEPLTDSQKAEMTEEEIKQWEEKAKAGILANDGILRSIVSGLRNAVLQAVDGTGLTLSSIGIKSASWLDKGRLYVDEDRLHRALSENPDQVFDLFTKQSNVLYSSAANDLSAKSERFNKSGLIQRISDVIQDNIRTNTYGGHRGALLEKAGIAGDRSQFNNLLYNQISDYDTRIDRLNDALFAKENSYYSQFAQLEMLINNMNTQSTWLAQQFAY
ncbi:MAG: flagellar filament capping protein FliD [Clostridiaceae bacterium]|nr:flagellar filament capping protein FliD [Clostridiaceae bacterium]